MNTGDVELRKTIRDKENAMESWKTMKIETNKKKGDLSYSGRKETKDLTPSKTTSQATKDKKLKKD